MNLHLLKQWVIHFHLCTDEHSLHSPFFYSFYTELIKNQLEKTEYKSIEEQRERFKKDDTVLKITDLGAGSKKNHSNNRRVKEIVNTSSSSTKFSEFLVQLMNHFQFDEVLELGTSLGLNTAYMASRKSAKIVTFEGDSNLTKLAFRHLKSKENVKIIEGNIDDTLKDHLIHRKEKIDLVYFDANHTFDATIRYFHQCLPYAHKNSIFIFDDIHWSKGMTKAWKRLLSHESVVSSIDIFDAGILFFDPELNKEHFILKF